MRRVWHKIRKVELKEHASGVVEIQRLPLLGTTPLLLAGGVLVFATVREQVDPLYLPMAAFAVGIGTGAALLLSVLFAFEIEVRDGEIIFGARPFYVRRIAIDQVDNWRPVTVRPQWRDIQSGRLWESSVIHDGHYSTITKGSSLPVPDRHGVDLGLTSGRHIFIGTAHPERLMHAIATAKFGASV